MRIKHNIIALTSFNKVNSGNKKLNQTIEKLATAMGINRAADDAAGLAISEKMRGQIRGLSQADKNIQDGISLVQVAEGGLSEIHSHLQRMRELSVQAANDTLTLGDRKQIQKEIHQLNRGINHIANHTEFNGINLLNVEKDPSYYDKYFNSFDNTGETVIPDPEIPKVIPNPIAWYPIEEEEIGFDISGKHNGIAWNGDTAVIVGSRADVITYDGETWSNDTIINDLNGEEISYDNQNVFKDVLWNGNEFVAVKDDGALFVSSDGTKWNQIVDDISSVTKISSISYSGNEYVAVGWNRIGRYGENIEIEEVMYTYNDSSDIPSWTEIDFKGFEFKHPSGRIYDVTWNEDKQEYLIVGSSRLTGSSTNGVDWNFENQDDLGGSLTGVAYGNGTYVAVPGAGTFKGEIYYSEDGENWSNEINVEGPSLALNFNEVRWTGEHFVVLGGETLGHAISKDGKTWMRTSIYFDWTNGLTDAVSIGDHFIAVGDPGAYSSGIYISGPPPDSDNGDLSDDGGNNGDSSNGNQSGNFTDGLILQVGPNSGDQFTVDLSDARTKSLKINSVDVTNHNSANEAIDKLDVAIQIISDERVKYGVYNNSLQHISNNVTNYEGNLTSAESRIRDADMAKTLMEQTKQNILSQTAQAMLAQAQQQPQGVLQLLQ